jgi:hypothetical protein
MRASFTLILLSVLASAGCYAPPPEGLRTDTKARPAGGSARKSAVVPTLGDPIPIPGTKFVAVPFAVQVDDEGKSKVGLGPSSIGATLAFYDSSYTESPGILGKHGETGWVGGDVRHWNNVFFRNEQTGDARLLFDRKVVITAAYFPADQPFLRKELLFAAVDADTNKDKYINANDAVVLYFATPDGATLTPLTPTAGSQFRGFTLDRTGRVLYARTRKDTDGNGEFTAADETVLLRVNLDAPAQGTPLLPADLVNRAFEIVVPGK